MKQAAKITIIRRELPQIEAAIKSGATQAEIITQLGALGLKISVKSFRVLLCRVRGQEKGSHTEKRGPKPKPARCARCGVECGGTAAAKKHCRKARPKKPTECTRCGAMCKNVSTARVHCCRKDYIAPFTGKCRCCGCDLPEHKGAGMRPRVCAECHGDRMAEKRVKPCVICGKDFFGFNRTTCCGPTCRAELFRRKGLCRIHVRQCVQCGAEFKTKLPAQAHCSRACALKTSGEKASARGVRSVCKHCKKEFKPKLYRRTSYCSRECYFAAIRTAERPRRKSEIQSPRSRRVKKRAKRRETVTVKRLASRDGDTCHICGFAVDFAAHPFTDKAATVDHLIPVSMGGCDVMDNAKLAHFICNIFRQDRKITPNLVKRCRNRILGREAKPKTKKAGSSEGMLF